MSTKLSEAILDDGILSVDFFNGRLLSAEDLRQERAANRTLQKLLGKAAGNGIAQGFAVIEKTNSPADPAVTIKPGLALSRSGTALRLKTETDLSLRDPSTGSGAALPAGFRACGATSGGTYVGADGAYLLVVSPAEGKQGAAPVSGLANEAATCNSKYKVDGVMFRLLRLDIAAADLADANRVRSLVAHRCFGTADISMNPFAAPTLEDYGALAPLRPDTLTNCDVPLAVILWSGASGIRYIDMWAVRRRITRLFPAERFLSFAGDRRATEGEAIFLQFQTHLADLLRTNAAFTAEQRFRYLPAGGYLPASVDWRAFLGPISRGVITPMRRTVMRSILHETFAQDPVLLTENPPLPVNVYQDPAHTEYVLFTRTRQGRLRVIASPSTATGVTASARSVSTGLVYGLKSEAAGFPPSVDVPPGAYHITGGGAGFLPFDAAQDTTAIGAQTVDFAMTLQPLPQSRINVQVINARTGADVTSAMSSVRAAGAATLQASLDPSANRWRFNAVPVGDYTITVVSSDYQTRSQSTTVGQAGSTIEVIIDVVPAIKPTKPKQCFDYRTQLKSEKLGYRFCMVEKAIYLPDQRKFQLNLAEPWDAMDPVDTLPAGMDEWLADWRSYLAKTYERYAIAKARPALYIAKTFTTVKLRADIPDSPLAWAVFGEVGIPLLVTALGQATRAPVAIGDAKIQGVKSKYVDALKDYGVSTVDQLAGAWKGLIQEATGEDSPYANYLIGDAIDAAGAINQKRAYLTGVDDKTTDSLAKLGYTDDVALANADQDKLSAEIGEGFAFRLIQQARQIVDPAAWNLDALGLSAGQQDQLRQRGVDSLGAFVSRTATDQGIKELARTIADKAGAAEITQITTLRSTAVNRVAQGQTGRGTL